MRQWKLVRVSPTRPEPTRTVIGVFDTPEEAWAEHDKFLYGERTAPNRTYDYVEVVRMDGTTV